MNDPKRIIIVLLGLVLVGMMALGIKGHMDSGGYKNQVNYTTAVQATEKDKFNYIVDSQQGRVLANGTFTADKDKLVKFDEMTQSFSFVKRVEEHYTMHTREVCTSDGDGHESCHTEVYYTWDEVNEETKETPVISFMARSYPSTLFDFSHWKSDTDACAFTAAGTGTGFFETKHGCIDGDFYLDDDNRYTYATAPQSFNASFLATTYGGLKPFNENSITLQDKSIGKILKDVGKYKLISFWVVTMLLIFLTIGAGFAAYAWVMEDGVWSTID